MRLLKKQFFYYELLFCVLTLAAGTLSHFLYEWSGYQDLMGFFVPVNESTWEHLKMLFFPALLLSFVEYWVVGRYFTSFITARTLGIFSGMAFILVFFYTYTGIMGQNYLWMDVLTYYLGVVLCFSLTWFFTVTKKAGNHTTNILSICFLLLFAYLFIIFTGNPPSIQLFKEPAPQLVRAIFF